MIISRLMAEELTGDLEMTRKLIERIPDDLLHWRLNHDLHTIGWNASHLTEIVGWVPGVICQGEFDMAPPGGEQYHTPVIEKTAELLERFDANAKAALAALQGVPDTVMDDLWSLKMADQVLFTMTKGHCLRKWVFSHTAHHRGILSTYMKLAGVKIVSIFEE